MDNTKTPSTFLHIMIKSPEETLYQGEAKSFSSINKVGRFDVLPSHANFISLIKDMVVVYGKDDKLWSVKIDTGILRVDENKVDVFLGIETLKEK